MRNVQNQDMFYEEIGDFMNVDMSAGLNFVPYMEQNVVEEGYWMVNGEGAVEFVPIYDIDEIEEADFLK